MNLNHATMTTQVNNLPRTQYGQPLLTDADTADQWWAMLNDETVSDDRPIRVTSLGGVHIVVDDNVPDLIADMFTQDIREPDLYDDGMAYWMSDAAVVGMPVEQVGTLSQVRDHAKRIQNIHTGSGWVRIAPSHYGIEVLSYHEHNGEPATHTAHEAWNHLDNATR